MNKFYITTPIYYVNSRPHIGHAYTTIVADVLARYYRFRLGKENVFFLTGTDEHGSKIAQKAERENLSPQDFANKIAEEYKITWQNLNISNNYFVRTTDEAHAEVVKQVWQKLSEAKTPKGNEVIYKAKYEGLYCVGCESYKKEEDLVDGKCPDHNIEPEFLSEENYYLRLSDYTDFLKEKISSDEIRVLPEARKKEVLSFLEQGLEDVAISRQNVSWGIPVPFDKTQTTYVWLDALSNYISALGYPNGENFKKFWPANVQLLGKDILKFHCFIWPAMLNALELPQPKNFFVHGYFTIDGKKMSKTLGNIIDPKDLIEEYGVDATRYLIISGFPFGNDGDVKLEEFKTKYNADLANGVGNLVSRVLSMAEKYCDSKVPQGILTAELDLKGVWQKIDQNYTDYKIFENIKEINEIVAWCDSYIDETKPWSLSKEGKQDELEQIIYNLLEIIRQLALLIMPILPLASDEILNRLQVKDFDINQVLEAGIKINKGEPLFLRK